MNQASYNAAGTQVEDYSPYLVQMHDAKKRAALAKLKAAYENNVAKLDREQNGLAEGYQAARNATAGAHEQQRRNFAQLAAANGLNSGTAGQVELTRGMTAQSELNQIDTAEASAASDLALKRAEAETEYNTAIAQAEYTGEHDLAAALYKEKVRVQEALIEREIRRQKYAMELAQAQQKTANAAERQSKQQLAEAGELYDEPVWDLPSGVYEALVQGKPEKAVVHIDAIWDALTAEQRKKTMEILAGYGFQYNP